MKEKMHITILSLGVCALMGLTFAISTKDYKEKTPKLNSAPETTVSSQKFVCTAAAVSDSSQETKEYNKNLDKWLLLYNKIKTLGGDATTYQDPCDGLKGKKRTECNINNVELRGVLNQIKKLEEKLAPYEACQKSLGITTKDSVKTISGEVTTTKEKNTFTWHEGEWATCSNGKQTRTIECQSNGKKVEDTKCEGKKPITSKVCTETEKSTTTVGKTKDCGIVNSNSFSFDAVREKQEDKNMQCFSDAIEKCSPSSIKIVDTTVGDFSVHQIRNGDFSVQIHGTEGGKCSISVNDEKNKKICSISPDIFSALVTYAKDNNKPIQELSVMIASAIIFDEEFNSSLEDNYKISCQELKAGTPESIAKWYEGEWSICSNGKQTRKVECQSERKKIDDSKCSGTKPITSKVCQDPTIIVPPTTSNSQTASTGICKDSDGGSELYVKGTATNGKVSKTDVCTKKFINSTFGEPNFLHVTECSVANGDECYIEEAVCLTGSEEGLVGQGGSGELKNKCKFGCSNGACRKS